MTDAPPSYADLYSETIPSVVSIYTDGGDPNRPRGAGSGFVYDELGYVVTNQHVVRDADRVEVRFSSGEWRTGRVVGADRYTDLAVVEVPDLPAGVGGLPVATDSPAPGEPVAALGNPMGLDGTISTGIVSGVNRSMPTGGGFAIPDTVQTDAPINPGNSGGPLVTPEGEVVGVNRARSGDNIGFAVSPALVRRVVPDLIESGGTAHATLGVSTLDVSPTVAAANSVDPGGVLVVDVREGPASGVLGECTDAVRVGGRTVPVGGDVVVGVERDGVFSPLHSHEELTRFLMAECHPGDEVALRVRRPAGETTETVVLAGRGEAAADPDGSRIGIE
jgi:S1-C subfamily serine protease